MPTISRFLRYETETVVIIFPFEINPEKEKCSALKEDKKFYDP